MKRFIALLAVSALAATTQLGAQQPEHDPSPAGNIRAAFMEYIGTIEDERHFIAMLQGARCAQPVEASHPLEARERLIQLIDTTDDEAVLEDLFEGSLMGVASSMWNPPASTCDRWRAAGGACWEKYNGCLDANFGVPSACHSIYQRCAYWEERLEDGLDDCEEEDERFGS